MVCYCLNYIGTDGWSFTLVGTANGRPVTGGEIARPVTAVRGAGFQSGASGIRGTNVGVFDPLNQAKSSPIVTLQLKDENDPKERIKDMEACINSLVEESVRDASKRNFKLALEKVDKFSYRKFIVGIQNNK